MPWPFLSEEIIFIGFNFVPIKFNGECEIILPPSIIFKVNPAFNSNTNPLGITKGCEITMESLLKEITPFSLLITIAL